MYGFNWSESNLGRGDVAPERGLAGERMPGNPELAIVMIVCDRQNRTLAIHVAGARRGDALLCCIWIARIVWAASTDCHRYR
jgi:hypothetical protein